MSDNCMDCSRFERALDEYRDDAKKQAARIETLERELAEAKAKLETAETSARVLLRGADFEVDKLRAQLTAANATIAACKEAGFIDEQGNVRKVLGTLPLTADGAIVAFGAQVYHPMSVWNGGLHVESAGDGAEVYVPIKKSSDSFVSKSMWTNVSDCYSTPTAPAAAREKGGA